MSSPNAIAQAGNLFVFTMNNPVRWIDPSGLSATLPCLDAPVYIRWSPPPPGWVPSWLRSDSTPASTPAPTPPAQRIFGFLATIGGGSMPNFYDIGGGASRPTIMTREEWRALEPARLDPFTRDRTAIVIHHTTGGTINSIDRWHRTGVRWTDNQGRQQRGWPGGIGYHFLIREDGLIYQGRPIDYIGTHASGRNATSIGVAVMGDFTEGTPSPAQLSSMFWLIDHLMMEIPTIYRIEPHWSDFACPGPWFDDFFYDGRRRR